MMIDLHTNAKVYCSDGAAGRSTYVVFNPNDHRLTNLVVKSNLPPFNEYLVPVDQVEEAVNDQIKLKCTLTELEKMELFECDQYMQTKLPEYHLERPGYIRVGEVIMRQQYQYIPVRNSNIPLDERTVRRGAQVKATDGTVGQVDALLIDSSTMQVTHIVLLQKRFLEHREITIPVSMIERVYEDTIYLNLDQESINQLPTVPVQRWPQDEHEKARLENSSYFPLRFSSEGYTMDFKLKKGKMMDKMIVVVFDSELKAYDGSRALQELQSEGSINLYAKAVVVRDAAGKAEVKQEGDMGPVGTAVGLFTGTLIGVIGGPVGAAIGAGVGMSGGALYDLAHLGISADFLAEVEKSLLPGKAAVVAEVWEEWTMPVDSRMESLGGVVYRRSSIDVVDDQIERDITLLNAELDELEAERDQATGEARAKLQVKVDATKAKLQAAYDAFKARVDASQKESDAKIQSLQEQADHETGKRKEKREARIAELKAEKQHRSDLLKQAWELTKDALSS